MLDTTPFRDALTRLEKMLTLSENPVFKGIPDHALMADTAVAQGFEYTYEMAYKFMQRYINTVGPNAEIDNKTSFKELLRAALKYGIAQNTEAWLLYRDVRNATSHDYGKTKVDRVMEILPLFLKDARFTLETIESKITGEEKT